MDADLFINGDRCSEREFDDEAAFEQFITEHAETLFGDEAVFLEMKKQIDSQSLGGTVPDGFLFDLSDPDNPEFYLVEVELERHDFFGHIFPQITKFLSSKRQMKNERKLAEAVHQQVEAEEALRERFEDLIGDREIYKTIQDAVFESSDILLLIDGNKPELAEVYETYPETWGRHVTTAKISAWDRGSDSIISIEPKAAQIGLADMTASSSQVYDESYYLDDLEDETKEIFWKLKEQVQEKLAGVDFNHQKNYISLRDEKNFAYLRFTQSKIHIVVMLPIDRVEPEISHHALKEPSESVQEYYNGPCSQLTLEQAEHLEEVLTVLQAAHEEF